MSEVNLPLSNCHECPLYCERSYNPHNYWGDLDECKVLFVGEAPGGQEKISGKVFQGKAGILLQKTINKMGITNYALCNTVACRPEKTDPVTGRVKDGKPKKTEIKFCAENLDAIIEHTKPDIIVPLGTIACDRFKIKGGITANHGIVSQSEEYGCKLLPMFHPAYIIRTPQYITEFETDFETLRKLINGEHKKKEIKGKYKILTELSQVKKLANTLINSDRFAFDIETTGNQFWKHDILGIGFSWKEGVGAYIPLLVLEDDVMYEDPLLYKTLDKVGDLFHYWDEEHEEVIKLLQKILTTKEPKKLAHNFKFEIKFCEHHFNIRIPNVWMDTMLAHYVLDETKRHGLKEVGSSIFPEFKGYDAVLDEYLTKKDKEEGGYAKVPLPVLGEYCAIDCDLTLRIAKVLYKELNQDKKLKRLLFKFYMPLTRVYAEAEKVGARIDKDFVNTRIAEYEIEEAKHLKAVYDIAGNEFNLNSPKQLQQILYEDLGLPITLYTESGAPSTAEGALKEMPKNAKNIEIVNHILEYRGYNKALSTYLRPFVRKLDPNGRIHNSFLLHGTTTGRLSSKGPNLQNIPRDKKIKGMFIADPDFYPVEIDYSQAELRVMAYYSQDPVLKQQYLDDGDVHLTTACFLFHKKPHEITKWERKRAKLVNFGFLYGAGWKKALQSIKEKLGPGETAPTEEEMKYFRRQFFDLYEGIEYYIRETHRFIQQEGYVKNCFGRIRRLPQIMSPDEDKQHEALREGLNAIIQCIAENQKILTDRGYIDIEKLNGQSVARSNGFSDKYVLLDKGVLPVYLLKTYHGKELECTKNHKFFTFNGLSIIEKKLEDFKIGEPIVVRDVLAGDGYHKYFNTSKALNKANDKANKQGGYIKYGKDIKPKVSKEEAELIGILLGDGSFSTPRSKFSISIGDEASLGYSEHLQRLIKDLYGEELPTTVRVKERVFSNKVCKTYVLTVSSKLIKERIKSLGLDKQIHHNKEIPTWAFDSTPDIRASMLKGLFDTDGGFSSKTITYTTISKELIKGVGLLLSSLGIKFHSFKDSKGVFRLNIKDNNKFASLIGSSHPVKLKKLSKSGINHIDSIPSELAKYLAHIVIESEHWLELTNSEKVMLKRIYKNTQNRLTRSKTLFIKLNNMYNLGFDDILSKQWDRIDDISFIGDKNCYDLSFEDSPHDFVTQGILTHNSTASDIAQIGLIKAYKFLKKEKARSRFILSVHDALIFEFHKDEIDMIGEVKSLMEQAPDPFDMPVLTEPEIFLKRWGWDKIDYNPYPNTTKYRLQLLRKNGN